MATTITTHCKMGIVDSSGNVNVLYPQTTGSDVSITANAAASGATTVQALVNALTASAFIENFTGIDDESTTSQIKTWSANKIASEISGLNSNLGSPNSASSVTGADAFSKISTLNNAFTKNKFDTRVSIVSYTSTLYKAPSDGYVSAYGGYDPSKNGSYEIYGEDATSINDTHMSQVVYGLTSSCTFIRKGMKVLYSPGNLDSYKNLYFIPLK